MPYKYSWANVIGEGCEGKRSSHKGPSSLNTADFFLSFFFKPYLTVEFSGTKYIHIVVQLSPSSTSPSFRLPKLKLSPLSSNSPFCSPPPSTNEPSDTVILALLGISCKWNQTVFVCIYCILEKSCRLLKLRKVLFFSTFLKIIFLCATEHRGSEFQRVGVSSCKPEMSWGWKEIILEVERVRSLPVQGLPKPSSLP